MSRDHYQTEQFVRSSGLAFTILRDSFYMELIPEMFGEERVMKGPGGNGKVAWVSRRNVSEVVAEVLKNPAQYQGIFEMTGVEAFSLSETAKIFTEHFKATYRYRDETLEEARKWRKATGAPDWEVDTWVGSNEAIAENEMASVTGDIKKITGKTPALLKNFLLGYMK